MSRTSLHTGHILLLALFLSMTSGCGNKPQDNTESAREFVSIGTAPPGGAFFMVGNAIADVVNTHKGERNWIVSAEATKGTQENIRRLEAGDIQFGMANAAISYFATRGDGAWKEPHDIRVVATMAHNVGLFITTPNSGIKSIADFKGKRIVLGPAGAGFHYFLRPLLAAHGISYDDITELNSSYTGTVDLLADGKADAAFMGGAVPIPAVTQACASQDIVFIPFADNVMDTLKVYPFYSPVTISADSYSDLESDMTGINVGNMHLITHASVSDDVVEQFLELLYTHRSEVADQHPAGRALNPKNAIRDTGTSFHPGAISFYEKSGLWPKPPVE
jgi:TRAP transporter TAXI family solute receptor